MSLKILDQLRVKPGVVPQDITTQRQGPWTDVSGAQRMLAAVITGAVANTKTVTVGFLQAQDAAGTGSKALGTPVTLASAADGSSLQPMIGAQIADLDENNGYGFVAVTLLSNNATAVQASALMLLADNRFNP